MQFPILPLASPDEGHLRSPERTPTCTCTFASNILTTCMLSQYCAFLFQNLEKEPQPLSNLKHIRQGLQWQLHTWPLHLRAVGKCRSQRLHPLMSSNVVLYVTSVTASAKVRADTERVRHILSTKRIPFVEVGLPHSICNRMLTCHRAVLETAVPSLLQVDVSLRTEEREHMVQASGVKTLPQLHVGGRVSGATVAHGSTKAAG